MNEISTLSTHSPASALSDQAVFSQMQRVGKMLSESQLVPQHLRGKVADCSLVAIMAVEMNINPIMLAQNIYFVSGTPGWRASYLIARANASGKLREPIQFAIDGQGDKLTVTAFAKLRDVEGKGRIEASVSMATAKAEGWTKNAKYQSMPQQMLSYRAATLLVRLYLPEIMLGLSSADELQDMKFAGTLTEDGSGSYGTAAAAEAILASRAKVSEAEIVEADEEPAPEPEPDPDAPPFDPEDFPPQPDHFIPVPVTLANEPDWTAWAKAAADRIKAAPDIETRRAILEANSNQLGKLGNVGVTGEQGAKWAARLRGLVEGE